MQFYHSGQIPTDLAEKSYAANLLRLMPNGTAPIFALSGLAKKKKCLQIEHGYWSKTMEFTNLLLTANITADTQTVLQCDSVSTVIPNQIIRIPRPFSGSTFVAPEYVRVISVDRVNNRITVERGFGGTTKFATLSAGAGYLMFGVGNAHEEGSLKPTPRSIIPVRHMNYTQIFRNAWSTSRTMAAIKMIVGQGAVAENKMDATAFHAQDIEFATLFGRKSMGVGPQGNPLHTMDGFEAVIEQYNPDHLMTAGATTSYKQLESMLDKVLDTQTDVGVGNTRDIFLGSKALQVINEVGRLSGEYQLNDGQTNFGMSFRTFQTSRGKFRLIEHPLLNTNDYLKGMAFVLDLSAFDYAYMDGRDTQIEYLNGNMQSTDGTDASGGILTTELTTEIQNPFSCAIIYGLTAGAAS